MRTRLNPRLGRGLLIAAAAAAFLTVPATADLLTVYETTLEGWLGQGNLDFTILFEKGVDGSDSAAFHSFADEQGATLVLMSVSGGDRSLPLQTIGGYNPRSWTSDAGYIETLEGGAFIFNLTFDVLQQQTGIHQTIGGSNYGPTFGGGHDILVRSDLTAGRADPASYGISPYASITRDSSGASTGTSGEEFIIGALEVYTFAPAQTGGGGTQVPDAASTVGLLGLGLLGLAALRRRIA